MHRFVRGSEAELRLSPLTKLAVAVETLTLVQPFVERRLGPLRKTLPSSRPGRMGEHGRQTAGAIEAEPLLHRHPMATEQGGGRLDRGRLTRFEQIQPLETCLIRSGLLASEPVLEVCFRFGDSELVNACHSCCLNAIATLYHL